MDDKGGILNQCRGGGLFNQAELEQLASHWVNTYSEIKNLQLWPYPASRQILLCCMMFCKNINELQMILNEEIHWKVGRRSGPRNCVSVELFCLFRQEDLPPSISTWSLCPCLLGRGDTDFESWHHHSSPITCLRFIKESVLKPNTNPPSWISQVGSSTELHCKAQG